MNGSLDVSMGRLLLALLTSYASDDHQLFNFELLRIDEKIFLV